MYEYKRLTIPSLAKETTLHKAGFFSKARLASQDSEEDQITLDLPVTLLDLPVTSFEHQSIHLGDSRDDVETIEDFEDFDGFEDHITLDLPAMPSRSNSHQISPFLTIPFTPRPTQSNGHVISDNVSTFPVLPSIPSPTQVNGRNGSKLAASQPDVASLVTDPQLDAIVDALVEQMTHQAAWESLAVSATQSKGKAASKWAFFLELPHLLVYIIGAFAIVGLYLIIPLLNLLNATAPGNMNTLLMALGIIAPAELLVCFILARTLPRGKVKKRSSVAQP